MTVDRHLKFAASRPAMWQRPELICDYFAGLVNSCFIHSWGNWGLQRKDRLRRQLRNSTLKQNSNFCIIDTSAKLITHHTQNTDLKTITENKFALKNFLCIIFRAETVLKVPWPEGNVFRPEWLQEFRKAVVSTGKLCWEGNVLTDCALWFGS